MGALLRLCLTDARLREAWARVRDNHGQPGADGISVETFEAERSHQLYLLRREALAGRYRPQPLLRAWLARPDKAPRPLGIPAVRDRVLQTAVAQTLEPRLEDEFEACSYAYRRGRSVRMAVERIGILQRQGYRWVVEADIEKFFDCIPHEKLLAELRELAPDDELLALVRQWLICPVRDGEHLIPVSLGVPQGAPISPPLANLYLDHLDEALLDEGHALVRYADDFVVLAKTRDRAEAALELSAQVLQDLELRLNPHKTRIVDFDTGFEYLGHNFIKSLVVPVKRAGRRAGETPRAISVPPAEPREAASAIADEDDDAMPSTLALALMQAGFALREPGEAETSEADDPVAGKTLPDDPLQTETATDPAAPDSEPTPPPGTPAPDILEIPRTESAPGDADRLEADTASWHDDDPPPVYPPPSLQRTLYLVDPEAALVTRNHHLIVRRDDTELLDLPANVVDQVMLFGRNHVSTAALVCCLQHDIPVAFLSRSGRYYGRLDPPNSEAVHLQAAQFARHAEGALDLPLAREFVRGKLANARRLFASLARNRRGDEAGQALLALKDHEHRLATAASLDVLRGHEGAASVAVFGIWRVWLAPGWRFGPRVAQQAADPVNVLLDFGSSLLHHAVAGLIQARGLNPWLGHLHRPAAGHMALASDLMEEFRPVVVDAIVLDLLLNGGLKPEDFIVRGTRHALKPAATRKFLRAIETRLNRELHHPRTGERVDLRRIIDSQACALAHAYRHNDPTHYQACRFR
jgi:CRISP-associated protein Cas1